MRGVLIDTNVLLSFLTDRDLSQQGKAAELMREASAGTLTLWLHQVVLIEMVFVLLNLYRRSPAETASLLGDLLQLPGVRPLDEAPWPRLLDLWPAVFTDFPDALLAAVVAERDLDAIATFDLRFARRLRDRQLPTYW
ncbi:MAG: PIN domain-containing protein [Acidobacteria bacterium]|nr:PIN domain-containing protein [Acidobacteriota bacterium]